MVHRSRVTLRESDLLSECKSALRSVLAYGPAVIVAEYVAWPDKLLDARHEWRAPVTTEEEHAKMLDFSRHRQHERAIAQVYSDGSVTYRSVPLLGPWTHIAKETQQANYRVLRLCGPGLEASLPHIADVVTCQVRCGLRVSHSLG